MEGAIKTKAQAKDFEEIIVVPYTYVQRAALLLNDFIGEYFDTIDGVTSLISDLQIKSAVIWAKIESIAEHIETGKHMLNECLEYRPAEQ